MNPAQTGYYAGSRRAAPFFVHAPGCIAAKFENLCPRIEQQRNALAGGESPLIVLAVNRLRPSTLTNLFFLVVHARYQVRHGAHVLFKPGRGRVNF